MNEKRKPVKIVPVTEDIKTELKVLTEQFEKNLITTRLENLEKAFYRTSSQVTALIEIIKKLEERIITLTTTSEEVLNTVDTNSDMFLEYITGNGHNSEDELIRTVLESNKKNGPPN